MSKDQEKLQELFNYIKDYINVYISENEGRLNYIEGELCQHGEKVNLRKLWDEFATKVFIAENYNSDTLEKVGLTGNQINFKIQAFKFLKGKNYKICDLISTILGSLGIINPCADGLNELLKIICFLNSAIK